MTTKTFKLKENEVSLIGEALAKLADFHFEKSKTLKREADAKFHKEKFQAVMDLKLEIYEQKKGQ
jgi:hypothetical protein